MAELDVSLMKLTATLFSIWTLVLCGGVAAIAMADGATSPPNLRLYAALLWIFGAASGAVLIFVSSFTIYKDFYYDRRRYAVTTILICLAIPIVLFFATKIYLPISHYSEINDFNRIGTTELRNEVFHLMQLHLKNGENAYLTSDQLPPHLQQIGAASIWLSPAGLSMTTDGLGSHRSGYLITPIDDDESAESPMDGIERWSH